METMVLERKGEMREIVSRVSVSPSRELSASRLTRADSFFEGARITLEAHIAEYPPENHAGLRAVLAIGDAWRPDRVIVLTSNTDTIEKHIRHRNRPHEDAENMVRRFRLIDGEFRRLAPLYPNAVVVNRDHMEFHQRAGLVAIIQAAGLPMFAEIPYKTSD